MVVFKWSDKKKLIVTRVEFEVTIDRQFLSEAKMIMR